MSEDVCDSWEDLIVNDCLNEKLKNDLKIKKSTNTNLKSSDSKKENGSIKILKKNVDKKDQNNFTYSSILIKNSPVSEKQKNSTSSNLKNYNLNSFVKSQPFVPQTYKNLQITLDENTRNQLIPQTIQQKQPVKILQRPKNDLSKTDSFSSNLIKNGSLNAKTFQERQAEYAKARLRILGSAVPNYDEDVSEKKSNLIQDSFINKLNLVKEDNLIRQPQGPNNTQGFLQRSKF